LEGTVQYDDDELEARQLGFVTVHCKHASNTPPSNRFYFGTVMLYVTSTI